MTNPPEAPFGRVLTAMATAFHDDGSVDLEGTARIAVHLVEHGHDGVVGRGEASPVYYRGESVQSALDFLTSAAPPLVGEDPFALEDIEERLEDVDGEAAGKAALDAALHDWIGRRLGVPLWRLLGLSPEAPATSFTISIDSVDGTRDRARRAGRTSANGSS